MALRVRIKNIVNGSTPGIYTVYSELYDDANPTAAISGKQHSYSTTVTDAQVLTAVRNDYATAAQAYINKLKIRTYLETVIATLTVPTT